MGFAVLYMRDGEIHDYAPDFIIRLTTRVRHLGALPLPPFTNGILPS